MTPAPYFGTCYPHVYDLCTCTCSCEILLDFRNPILLPSKPSVSSSTSADATTPRGGGRKKKAPRFVASRYMQTSSQTGVSGSGSVGGGAGGSKQQPMKATDRV